MLNGRVFEQILQTHSSQLWYENDPFDYLFSALNYLFLDVALANHNLERFEEQYGTIQPGSFVLFYTGWSHFWNEPNKYHNNLVFPSVSADAAQFLLARNIAGIGIDTLSPDCDERGSFVHAILLGADKYIVENVAHAEQMPAVGAYIFIMPLNVQGAAESPVRLIALIPPQ